MLNTTVAFLWIKDPEYAPSNVRYAGQEERCKPQRRLLVDQEVGSSSSSSKILVTCRLAPSTKTQEAGDTPSSTHQPSQNCQDHTQDGGVSVLRTRSHWAQCSGLQEQGQSLTRTSQESDTEKQRGTGCSLLRTSYEWKWYH